MIIGIDLGTTFSVIAVPGRIVLTPGYPSPRYLEHCDVTIIPDRYGNYIIPSAIWEDPDEPGTLIVGVLAKQAADDGESPIMFSKRNIGTDIQHPLGSRSMTARSAAKEILVYLKAVAEEALGKRVDRAVITHPAYFSPAMREETALAAMDAGFEFDQEKHLLMEPTAAALTYTRTDARDPLNLLTYDLGGGTFDIAVMERRAGVVKVKAHGGNRLLGGFNFDRELATWLLRRMQGRGIRITIDPNNPKHRGKWARLLRVAEDTKIKLADAPTDLIPVRVKQQNVFEDDGGNPVTLTDEITRKDFVEMIRGMLEGTITGSGRDGETEGCEATLAKVGWTVDKVHEILLVGGSCWAPWVAGTIRRLWNREAKVFDPDQCVAAGAAIHIATLPVDVTGSSCRLDLDAPRQSVLECVTVGGRLVPTSPMTMSGLSALLSRPGRKWDAPLKPNGDFVFSDVDLELYAVSAFVLSVVDEAGRSIIRHEFQIVHAAEPGAQDTPILSVLPKPLYIETMSGMQELAPEGATLPAHCDVDLVRINEESTIEIRLFHEADPIGSVVIRDVPTASTTGSKVRLSVDISRNNRISGRAIAYTRKGSVAAEAPVDIRIPPLQIPSPEELEREFIELESERAERLELERNSESRLTIQAKGDKIRRKIESLIKRPSPSELQEIWLSLRDLKRVVRPAKDEMEPRLDEFERLLVRIHDYLVMNSEDPQIQGHARLVERLEREGHVAHSKKDRKSWSQVNNSLEMLWHRLQGPQEEDDGSKREIDPTFVQKMRARNRLDLIRRMLRSREEELSLESKLEASQTSINRVNEAIARVEEQIENVSDSEDPKKARASLSVMHLQHLDGLERDIPKIGHHFR